MVGFRATPLELRRDALRERVDRARAITPNVTNAASAIVTAGIFYASYPSAWAIRVDNVTFDVQ